MKNWLAGVYWFLVINLILNAVNFYYLFKINDSKNSASAKSYDLSIATDICNAFYKEPGGYVRMQLCWEIMKRAGIER